MKDAKLSMETQDFEYANMFSELQTLHPIDTIRQLSILTKKKLGETFSNQNLLMSILNYFDYLAVIIKIYAKRSPAKSIVFQEILKNCLP